MQRAAAERAQTTIGRRRVVNVVMVGVTFGAAILATLPLIFILGHLIAAGASSINLDFFTQIPKPPGEAGGGMANAIVGSLVLILAASAPASTWPRTVGRISRTRCDFCPMS